MGLAWPVSADLITFLTGTGLWQNLDPASQAALDLAGSLLSAQAEFEEKTGWHPFLAKLPSTRYFNPPGPPSRQNTFQALRGGGRILQFDGGLLTFASLCVSGIDYEQNSQFWLFPANAPDRGRPWQWAEFIVPVYGTPQAVEVNGLWGRVVDLPQDVFNAVLQRAAATLAPQIALQISRARAEVKTEDVTFKFAGTGTNGPLANEAAAWKAVFDQTVKRYPFYRI